MKLKQLFSFSCLSVAVACSAAVKAEQHQQPIPSNHSFVNPFSDKTNQNAYQDYIVMFDDSTPVADIDELVNVIEQQLNGAKLSRFSVVKGFSGPIPPKSLGLLRSNQQVKFIEKDRAVQVPNIEIGDQHSRLASNGAWGIDRIDQAALPLDGNYQPNGNGTGVHAYIIDSGISLSHQDFVGRVSWDYTAAGLSTSVDDAFGHGTLVAGIVGGERYGVARQVTLHSVKVLDEQGVGTLSGLIAGIDYVTNNHQAPAVANIGVSYPFSQILNDAVAASIAAGVVYTVPSGDILRDACTQSPASLAATITVASSTAADQASRYANTGPCVDMYAPGLYVKSSWPSETNFANNSISHSPAAAAHVAGAAVIILANDNSCTVSQVKEKLIAQANNDVLANMPEQTFNRLLAVPAAGSGVSTSCGAVIVDSDNDGIADEIDFCADSADGARVDDNGCATEQLNKVTVTVPEDLRGAQLAQVSVTPAAYQACENAEEDFCGYYLRGTQVTINAVDISPGYEVQEWQNTMCEASNSCVVSSDVWPNVVLDVVQNQAISEVPVGGGTVEFENVATATFYNNSFTSATQVSIDDSNDASLWQDFNVTKDMFAASYPASHFVVIDSSTNAPAQDVSLSIHLGQSYIDNQPANTSLQVFVALLQQSTDVTIDSFEMLDSQFQSASNSINATLPKQSFTNLRDADGHYRAVAIVAAIPNGASVKQSAKALRSNDNRLFTESINFASDITVTSVDKEHKLSQFKVDTSEAEGKKEQKSHTVSQRDHLQDIEQSIALNPPQPLPKDIIGAKLPVGDFSLLNNPFARTSTANAAQCPVSIAEPISGVSTLNQAFTQFGFHGVNYQLSASSTFQAIRAGTIVKAGQDLRYLADGSEKGWGRYVILEDDGGNRFLYSHLDVGHITEGQPVTKGLAIGNTLGNFGHFEFAPAQGAKINPTDCVEQSSAGLNCTLVDINVNYTGTIANSNDLLCVAVYPEVATKFTGFITNYNPSTVDFDLSLYLYNPADGGVLQLAQSATTGTYDLIAGVINPNFYLMVVNGRNGATGSFTIGSQGITEFDENEYNDTSATATVITGVDQISGSFDSAGDVDWFRYDFNSIVPAARIYNHNDNATMSIVAGSVTQIPAGSWATINGSPGQSVYIVMENNQNIAATSANKNSTAPWKISITGIEHHTGGVSWGSSETFNVRVNYWPHVHNYYQMTGRIYDASNALIPKGRVGLANTAVVLWDFYINADDTGYWHYRADYPNCNGVLGTNVITTDNYGRYLWDLSYNIYATNWWAVNVPTHILHYVHLCSARVIDSEPW